MQCSSECVLCAAALQAQEAQAALQTRGMAPLVQSAVLTDRRHILTKDADGNVDLWDIATAAVEQRFGKVVHCHQITTYVPLQQHACVP